LQRAFTAYQAAGQHVSAARALNHIGWAQLLLGNYEQGLASCEKTVALIGSPVAPAALTAEVADKIACAIEAARAPLVVTSYLGRDPAAVPELVRLCELAAVPVIESVPAAVSFPDDHRLHLGYQWNRPAQNPHLAEADVIVVLGSDVPWIPAHNRPDPSARIFVIDIDPIKIGLQLWHVPATRYARADLATAVRQLVARLTERGRLDPDVVADRSARTGAAHDAQRAEWARLERPAADGTITAEYLVACVRDAIGPDALVLNEAISNYHVVTEHLRASRPGSLLNSGGGSLGWAVGAAVGAKLAAPDRTVVSLVGDGSYLFGVPSSAQWMARRYDAPSLTVIFDNQGWKTPSLSTQAVHPRGRVAAGGFTASFQPGADLPGTAGRGRRCLRQHGERRGPAAARTQRGPGGGQERPRHRH
jgi:acetolactate synthase-1/2/3 large subunit